jgi:hypothetical protein
MGGGLYRLPFSFPPTHLGHGVLGLSALMFGQPVAEDSFVRMCRWVSAEIK